MTRMRKTTKAEKTPIKTAIVGLGRAGWGMHLRELEGREKLFDVVAACDLDGARLARFQERFPGGRTFRRFETLLKDPGVELVSIATRSPDHVKHALAALRAGKTVFVEKPIGLKAADAARYRAAARRHPGRLFFRHNRRFETAFQHVREIIASGLLGDVFEVKLRRLGYQRRDDWQTLKACGGGQLNNWGPHIIDHALRLLESPVADVWSDLKKVAAVGDAEDHLKIVLRGRNGRVVDLEISGGAALGEPVYSVFGSKGALTSDEREIRLRYLDPAVKLPSRRASRPSPPMEGSFGNPDKLVWVEKTIPVAARTRCSPACIWDHLHAAIRKGRPFPVSLEEALEVLRVTCAVRRRSRVR